MKEVSSAPFFRILFAFAFGIILELLFPNTFPAVRLLFCFLALCYFILYFFFHFSVRNTKTYLGILSIFLLITFGMLLTRARTGYNNKSKLPNIHIEAFEGVIDSEVEEKPKTYKCELLITKIKTRGAWVNTNSRILLYIFKDTMAKKLCYGNYYIVKEAPKILSKPLNPVEFDYSKYYATKGIFYQNFASYQQMAFVKHSPPSSIKQTSFHLREVVDGIFSRYIALKREKV